MGEVGVEQKELTRVDRIKMGIGKWVENQMPPAVSERYKKTFTVFAEKLAGNRPELMAKLQRPIEVAAKAAGWADPVIKTAVGAAALYGGIQLLIHPEILTAVGGAAKVLGAEALAWGQKAYIVGATQAERGFRFVVDKGGDLIERARKVVGNIFAPKPVPNI